MHDNLRPHSRRTQWQSAGLRPSLSPLGPNGDIIHENGAESEHLVAQSASLPDAEL